LDCGELAELIFKCKTLWVAIFPPTSNFSYEFVNFYSLDAWPGLVSYLGPAPLYSGEYWEIMCQSLRRLKIGNNVAIERSILERHSFQQQLQWHELPLSVTPVSPRKDYTFIGSVIQKNLNSAEIKDLKSCYRQCFNKNIVLHPNVSFATKTILSGKTVEAGTYLLIQNSSSNIQCFAIFKGIVQHQNIIWINVSFFSNFKNLGSHVWAVDPDHIKNDYVPVCHPDWKIIIAHAFTISTGKNTEKKTIFNEWIYLD